MHKNVHLLLADDDMDDRYFFDKALKDLSISANLTTVEDGAKLMDYLSKHSDQLPDVLFLDLNMPRKNGSECLTEIKDLEELKSLPVIIYSTSQDEEMADLLYKKGAHYYIRKGSQLELEKVLLDVLNLIGKDNLLRPARNKFTVPPLENLIKD